MRLGEQKQADLRNVRAGGDVDEVIFLVRVEAIPAGEVEQRGEDRFKIPRVLKIDPVRRHRRLRRDRLRVRRDLAVKGFKLRLEQNLKPRDEQILVLAERN